MENLNEIRQGEELSFLRAEIRWYKEFYEQGEEKNKFFEDALQMFKESKDPGWVMQCVLDFKYQLKQIYKEQGVLIGKRLAFDHGRDPVINKHVKEIEKLKRESKEKSDVFKSEKKKLLYKIKTLEASPSKGVKK